MKKIVAVLICSILILSGCIQKSNESPQILEIGDSFTLTGTIDYSDRPSDIGQEYCSVTIKEKKEYYYNDIYDKRSKWSSNIFFTKGNDTILLKDYVGSEITISGTFDAESHGIPYITNITISE